MRRSVLLAAVLALVASVSPVRSEDKPAGHPLPVNPFANAKEGAWLSVVTTVSALAGEGKEKPERVVYTWRVTKVADDRVTVVVERSVGGKVERSEPRTFSAKEPPTLEAFLEMTREKVEDVKVEDATIEVAGQKIAVKRITFVNVDGSGARADNVLCIAEGVPGVLSLNVRDAKNGVAVHVEAGGAGTGDAVQWGKKADDLAR